MQNCHHTWSINVSPLSRRSGCISNGRGETAHYQVDVPDAIANAGKGIATALLVVAFSQN
jgi:hypothetical protein